MKKVICKFCGKPGHYKFNCLEYQKTKPRGRTSPLKPLSARIGKHHAQDRQDRLNYMYEHGGLHSTWECYLRISPMCLVTVDYNTLALEHIQPKGTHPELRHDRTNHAAACSPCNNLKGSSSLEFLSERYPHLKRYVLA